MNNIDLIKPQEYSLIIGNDLVNVSLERCKTKHLDQKFINRILHFKEQDHLKLCLHKAINLWMIWAAKEAAFKACQRQNLDLIFSHKKFEVEFDFKKLDLEINNKLNNFNLTIYGTVKYENKLLQAVWQVNNNLIHCICVLIINNNYKDLDLWKNIKYKIFNIDSSNYKTESLETKTKAQQYLIDLGFSEKIEIKRPCILIKGQKRYAPPTLFIDDMPYMHFQISLSHDHGWGAVVIEYIDS